MSGRRHSALRWFRAACVAALCALGWSAQAAGVQPLQVPADAHGPELRGMVWTPCGRPAESLEQGVLRIMGTRDCSVAGHGPLPWVVISHGSGGSALGHHDTAAALADAGFVVAAIHHPGDNFRDLSRQGRLATFATRPADITRLIDYLLRAWPERGRLDAQRGGFFGFSRGGTTGLLLLGAVPDFTRLRSDCPRFSRVPLCSEIEQPAAWPALPAPDPRIRAAVIADPLNLFDAAGLRAVAAPVQLWASALGGDGVAPAASLALRNALPVPPPWQVAQGAGHFVFLAPCSPALAREAPALCRDAPGVDRAAFHARFNAAVLAFLRQHLVAP